MNDTRDKILDKALSMFNAKGIEYVGMRELAAALDMRIGNITYYFPTKDDLVFQLSEQYTASNSKIHADHTIFGIYDFLKKNEMLFNNMINYRCLMLSMVHLMLQNPIMAARYEKVKNMRWEGLDLTVKTLSKNKFLQITTDEHWFLLSANSLISRFWMSEAALSANRSAIEEQVNHYLRLLAYLFKPYATKKGVKDIERFLVELGQPGK